MNDRLDPSRTALLLFDTLNGHLKTGDGVVHEKFRESVANMHRVLDAARRAGAVVAYAVASHRADGRTGPPQRTDTDNRMRPIPEDGPDPRPVVVGGTWEAHVIDELSPRTEDFVVPKYRWSAFFGTYLDLALRAQRLDTIVLVGGSTDIGIASTAFAARDLGYDLVIVRDACIAHELDNHEQLMQRVFPRMSRVRSAGDVVRMFAST
jgi:nicotinamidase-related amidase